MPTSPLCPLSLRRRKKDIRMAPSTSSGANVSVTAATVLGETVTRRFAGAPTSAGDEMIERARTVTPSEQAGASHRAAKIAAHRYDDVICLVRWGRRMGLIVPTFGRSANPSGRG